MSITFRQQKQSELEKVIAAERNNSKGRINTIKEPFESKWAEEKKDIKYKHQLQINTEEKSKSSAIAKLEQKQKEIESLHDGYFQGLNFSVGEKIKDITLSYDYGNPPSRYFFTFKTIAEIDKERKPKVEGTGGLCSCGKYTYKKSIQTRKSVHCKCTVSYIASLQNHYKQNHTNEIKPIRSQVAALVEEKKRALEAIKETREKQIQIIKKGHQLSDDTKEEINKETKILEKTISLSEIFKELKFIEQAMPEIINIKMGPSAFNPEKKVGDEEGKEEQPGLSASAPVQIPTLQPSSDFKKSKKLLNEILEQAYRVHYDDSCLRRSGTPKAFNILKALACCIIEIEHITNANDEMIYEKLKSACSLENSEQKNDREPMTIHHALKEPRRSVFKCCGLFGSTRAEKTIQKTIDEIDHPIEYYADSPIHGRHAFAAFAFLPRYGHRQ